MQPWKRSIGPQTGGGFRDYGSTECRAQYVCCLISLGHGRDGYLKEELGYGMDHWDVNKAFPCF